MIQHGSFLQWRLSLAETLAFGTSVAVLTFWIWTTFYPRNEQMSWKQDIDSRVQMLDQRISGIENNLTTIRSDVSYIRGRLEPTK